MRWIVFFIVLSLPIAATAAEVFRCNDPKGSVMWSMDDHKPEPDGFTDVNPVVIVEGEVMTVVWGDSKAAGGTEKVWKAVIIHRDENAVSGVALDTGAAGSAAMLYTIDLKRNYLYMSNHKDSVLFGGSSAGSFAAKCSR